MNTLVDKKELSNCAPIGVFDSGMGGVSVVNTIREVLPHENILYFGDSLYAPYGTKPTEYVRKRVEQIVNYLISNRVKAIVIACNTATSTSANILRDKYEIPILGMEPALKPAVEDGNKSIAVLATELTLKEKKFSKLMSRFSDVNIYRTPASELVNLVENGIVSEKNVHKALDVAFKGLNVERIDAIVLGCTHFIFAKKYIETYPKLNAKIYDGNTGTALHLKKILSERDMLCNKREKPSIKIENSDNKSIERTEKYAE